MRRKRKKKCPTYLNGIAGVEVLQAPRVLHSTLADVIDELHFLDVFIRLAVQLEIGFQLGAVVAAFAVGLGLAVDQDGGGVVLVAAGSLSTVTAVPRHVLVEFFQGISHEIKTNQTLEGERVVGGLDARGASGHGAAVVRFAVAGAGGRHRGPTATAHRRAKSSRHHIWRSHAHQLKKNRITIKSD